MNYELRIMNYELRIMNYELRITNYELPHRLPSPQKQLCHAPVSIAATLHLHGNLLGAKISAQR
jgi:hypothetical protein